MRPTLLNFRSPNERTPEFYEQIVTKEGGSLNFQVKSKNKNFSNFPQASRFKVATEYSKGSGASSFLGPGTYNDHDEFKKLVA